MKPALLIGISAFALFARQEGEVRFGTTVVIPTGLQGRIFHINKYAKKLPHLDHKKAVGTIYTTSLNIPTQDFRSGFPGVTDRVEGFAIDYTGKFWIEKPGPYIFTLASDDGSILYIDGKVVVDNDGQHATITKQGEIELSTGIHQIRVSYFQGPGFSIALVLQVEGPGMPRHVFSTDEFKPPSTLETLPSAIPHGESEIFVAPRSNPKDTDR